MNQSFRIAVKRTGREAKHYVIRDYYDLVNFECLLGDILVDVDDIEYIKWVPIPALEEV